MAVYWIGNNGNVYVRTNNGVKDYGKAIQGPTQGPPQGAPIAGYSGQLTEKGEIYGQRIDNPSGSGGGGTPTGSGTPAPTGGGSGGGGGVAAPVFNQAGADNTQRTINELPGLLERALAAEATSYGNVTRGFDDQETGQRKTYDTSTTTNQLNYDGNFMDSIRAGIKGVSGLMALLRGTGAGGGTAEDQARDAVGGVTANDIRTGADTQKENQIALDGSLSGFLTELQRKRQEAQDTRENNERAVRRDNSTLLQDLFGKMAGFYGDVGNTGEANNWMNRAGALTPEIAQNSSRQVSAYNTAPVEVKAPELTAFTDPTQPSVTVAPDGQVGSGIFTMNERRRRETAPVGV